MAALAPPAIRALLLLVAALALALALAGCGESDAPADGEDAESAVSSAPTASPRPPPPTPSEPPATPSPEPTLQPLPGHPPSIRSGDTTVDRVIDAVLAHDVDALLAFVRLDDRPCTRDEPYTQPYCLDDDAEGTVYPTFQQVDCHGLASREDELHELFSQRLAGEHRLYAMYTPGDRFASLWPDHEQVALFAWRPAGSTLSAPLGVVVGAGEVIRLNTWCFKPLDEFMRDDASGPPIVPPPWARRWPHGQTASAGMATRPVADVCCRSRGSRLDSTGRAAAAPAGQPP